MAHNNIQIKKLVGVRLCTHTHTEPSELLSVPEN